MTWRHVMTSCDTKKCTRLRSVSMASACSSTRTNQWDGFHPWITSLAEISQSKVHRSSELYHDYTTLPWVSRGSSCRRFRKEQGWIFFQPDSWSFHMSHLVWTNVSLAVFLWLGSLVSTTQTDIIFSFQRFHRHHLKQHYTISQDLISIKLSTLNYLKKQVSKANFSKFHTIPFINPHTTTCIY